MRSRELEVTQTASDYISLFAFIITAIISSIMLNNVTKDSDDHSAAPPTRLFKVGFPLLASACVVMLLCQLIRTLTSIHIAKRTPEFAPLLGERAGVIEKRVFPKIERARFIFMGILFQSLCTEGYYSDRGIPTPDWLFGMNLLGIVLLGVMQPKVAELAVHITQGGAQRMGRSSEYLYDIRRVMNTGGNVYTYMDTSFSRLNDGDRQDFRIDVLNRELEKFKAIEPGLPWLTGLSILFKGQDHTIDVSTTIAGLVNHFTRLYNRRNDQTTYTAEDRDIIFDIAELRKKLQALFNQMRENKEQIKRMSALLIHEPYACMSDTTPTQPESHNDNRIRNALYVLNYTGVSPTSPSSISSIHWPPFVRPERFENLYGRMTAKFADYFRECLIIEGTISTDILVAELDEHIAISELRTFITEHTTSAAANNQQIENLRFPTTMSPEDFETFLEKLQSYSEQQYNLHDMKSAAYLH